MPTWRRQDHAYQTAAAQFYAGDYAEADQAFAAIAQDSTSPWRPLARYMALRILARQHVSPEERGADTLPSEAERKQLERRTQRLSQTLLADASLAPWHASILRIRESLLLRYRSPEARLQLLSQQLSNPEDPATAARLNLLAQASRVCYWNNCPRPNPKSQTPGGDLLAWLNVMLNIAERGEGDRSIPLHETAWQRYQQHPRPAWLFASAVHMPPGDERQKVLQAVLR
jgi:hypothetical protein